MSVLNQKGKGSNLPNKTYRDKFDGIFRKRVMEVCKKCCHDMDKCTCKQR